MACTQINLMIDFTAWQEDPKFYEGLAKSYANFTKTDDLNSYDCGLISANCQSNITKKFDQTEIFWFDLFVMYIGMGALSLAGITGNVFNIIIISKTKIANDITNGLYLWLSCSDFVTISSCGAYIVTCYLCFADAKSALIGFNIGLPFLYSNIARFSLFSLDIVTIISVQRATSILFPFKVGTIFSRRNITILKLFFLALCLIRIASFAIIVFPRWIYHPYFDKVVPLGAGRRVPSNIFMNYLVIYSYLRSGINVIVITIAVSIILVTLNVQRKNRKTLKASGDASSEKEVRISPAELKTIKMSIAVCIITLVSYMSHASTSVIGQALFAVLHTMVYPNMIRGASIFLLAFNSSFNFLLYMTMSTQYRDGFFKLFKFNSKK